MAHEDDLNAERRRHEAAKTIDSPPPLKPGERILIGTMLSPAAQLPVPFESMTAQRRGVVIDCLDAAAKPNFAGSLKFTAVEGTPLRFLVDLDKHSSLDGFHRLPYGLPVVLDWYGEMVPGQFSIEVTSFVAPREVYWSWLERIDVVFTVAAATEGA